MSERPELSRELDAETFREYYYLKEELVSFCRENGLPASGGKRELTERIACFLETGRVPETPAAPKRRKAAVTGELTPETVIEEGFVCSEKHRAFFKSQLGDGFSFNVKFQKWLKSSAGKTYADAVTAYREIMAEKKKGGGEIGRQFEYNTYIRDFFADNPGRSLDEAIRCWKYKKSRRGHNRYEREDLKALG